MRICILWQKKMTARDVCFSVQPLQGLSGPKWLLFTVFGGKWLLFTVFGGKWLLFTVFCSKKAIPKSGS